MIPHTFKIALKRRDRLLSMLDGGRFPLILEVGFDVWSFSNMVNAQRRIGIDLRIDSVPKKMSPMFGNVNKMPFSDELFDLVVFTEVIEHLEKPMVGLREILRVLKPGGLLLLSTPNADTIDYRFIRLMKKDETRLYMSDDHVTEFRWKELRGVLTECGFNIVERRGTAFKIPRVAYVYLLDRVFPGLCEYTAVLCEKPITLIDGDTE